MNEDWYEIQAWYTSEHGWEIVCYADSREKANQRLWEYNSAEPDYAHRLRRMGELSSQ